MYQVYLPEHFLRQVKSYRKKYRHFEEDLIQTLENFQPSGKKQIIPHYYFPY